MDAESTVRAIGKIAKENKNKSSAINGIITVELLPLIIPGIAGMVIGQRIGLKIVGRIDIDRLKKLIYCFLAIAGLLTFVTNI